MIERITVELTPDELWALDTAAIYALEKRTMPTHIEMDVRPKLGSAIKALRTAEERARKGKKDANDAETDVHKALSAFNELDAQWESVPWEAINNALYLAEEYAKYHLAQSFGDDTDYDAELRAVDEWVRSNAPTKEPAK